MSYYPNPNINSRYKRILVKRKEYSITSDGVVKFHKKRLPRKDKKKLKIAFGEKAYEKWRFNLTLGVPGVVYVPYVMESSGCVIEGNHE
jgi:hypothetical protein